MRFDRPFDTDTQRHCAETPLRVANFDVKPQEMPTLMCVVPQCDFCCSRHSRSLPSNSSKVQFEARRDVEY